MTRAELLRQGEEVLATHLDQPRREALWIAQFLFGCSAASLLAHDDLSVSPEQAALYQAYLQRRARGEPYAYIRGDAWFYGRRFIVDPRVLVPRPETEVLIALALDWCQHYPTADPLTVADIGTGSGILALTIASELPSARVFALDCSVDALSVARANAVALEVSQRVSFCQSNLLASLGDEIRFDLLLANLPYLPSADIPQLPDALAFEPRAALDGGSDGLELYRALFGQLSGHLAREALVLLEAAPPTLPGLVAIARQHFPHATLTLERDLSGLERVLKMEIGEGRLA